MALTAPQRLPNGSRVWLAGEVQDFVQRLEELDPRLALVKNPDHSWSIWRVAEDGSEHLIARSKPYAKLDQSVLIRLQEGDLRRRGSRVVEDMIENNERLIRESKERAEEALLEAQERVLSKSWRGRIPTNVEDIEI